MSKTQLRREIGLDTPLDLVIYAQSIVLKEGNVGRTKHLVAFAVDVGRWKRSRRRGNRKTRP